MIITILCEPRTGSSNLLYWFRQHPDFSILLEPLNNKEYEKFSTESVIINDMKDVNTWKYKTKHLVIKEICQPFTNYINLIENSDKVIILFRENTKDQIESWLMAKNTDKWGSIYTYNESLIFDNNYDFLISIKKEIEKYKTLNHFIISYEELYYNNGIKKLLKYLDIKNLETIKFPYGNKFRKNKKLI